ncbi:hypothetical protein SAMN04487947_0434 [Halogeometricum rufum]|uniref:Uncharacterized protein n=1 Tax=Halogeometricum rufum TaxID=553469 RepID=A0A1I6G208_9EURY|nr:hypothetical protein SAMN04487947_0434 [Halogeometricum rufum]
MKRSRVVSFAVFAVLLVVTATPVAAANVSVVSQHTTDSDFEDATITNMSIEGTGAGASVVLGDSQTTDGFEDGNLDEYSSTGGWSVTSTNPYSGQYAAEVSPSDGNDNHLIAGQISDDLTLETWIYLGDRQGGFAISNTTSSDGYQLAIHPGQSRLGIYNWTSGNFESETTASLSYNTYYRLAIDYDHSTGDIVYYVDDDSSPRQSPIASTSATLSGIDGTSYGPYAQAPNSGSATSYFDEFHDSGFTPTSGSYQSQHTAERATQAAVDIAELTNATATITVTDDVSGKTLAQTTVSSAGNHTLSLLEQDSDTIDVQIDFEQDGGTPSVVLDDESILAETRSPSATNPSPNSETLAQENVTLSVDVADADFGANGDTVDLIWYLNGTQVATDSVSSNGTVMYQATELEDGPKTWHVELSDSFGSTTTSSTWSFDVQHYSPSIESLDPADNTSLTTRDITLSANLSDTDFALDGDTLTADFVVDGDVVGTDTLNSNGTASVSYTMDGGSASWHVDVSDEYGNSVESESRTIRSPSTLRIVNVTSGELIDGSATVTAKLYSGELIFEKETTDGTIDLTGVPVDRGYIIEVNVDGYRSRTVAIRSVFDQGSVYLLPEGETAVYQQLTLNDLTGEFEPAETTLYIERPIENNGTLEWQAVAGDTLGSDAVFKTYLEEGVRYRLIIENTDGARRDLGAYVAAVNGTATLEVGQIRWTSPKGDTIQYDAYVNESSNNLVVAYEDPEDNTSSFDIVIHERGNDSNILLDGNLGAVNTYQYTHPLTGGMNETDWVVEMTVERNRTITITEPVSSTAAIETGIPIDKRWGTLAGMLLLVCIGALFPSTLARVGAVAVVAIATGLSWLGWIYLPMTYVGLMGAVALLGLAAEFGDTI